MEFRELAGKLKESFGSSIGQVVEAGTFPHVVIENDALKQVLSFCSHDSALRMDFLDCMTGVDTGQDIVIIYQLFSTQFSHSLCLKVAVSRHSPKLASATGFWRAANAYELEIAEMFGVVFEGHPNPRPLLLPENWQGNPLRKDYVYPEEYRGIEHRREHLRKEHAKP